MDRLLAAAEHPTEILDELAAAFEQSKARRDENTRDGGLVIQAAHRLLRSWKRTSALLREPTTTLRRWGVPRGGAR